MNVLVARDLSISPPGAWRPVLRGVDISVARGEWIGVSGPNGGGKSSLILGLGGLWPSRGRLELHGRGFGAQTEPGMLRRLGVIFQDPSSQILQGSVFDEIAFVPRNLGRAEAEVTAVVERRSRDLGLEGELERDPARLSAGRQQLVLLAAALAGEPELLLADEATAHMDPENRARAVELVATEVSLGMGAVWVSQLASELGRATRWVSLGEGGRPGPVDVDAACEKGALDASASPRSRDRAAIVTIEPRPGEGQGPWVRVDSTLTVEIPSTGIVALQGANGTGKSVILEAVAGLTRCSQVSVQWLTAKRLPPIAALQFPEQQLFEDLVEDELVYAAVARGVARRDALDHGRRLLEQVGLDPQAFLGRKTWDLAGGERRLLETVAALAAPASVYILDEPTAGLDRARRQALAGVLGETGARSPILLASQDREWVVSLTPMRVEIGPRPVTNTGQRPKKPLTVG